MSRLRVLVLSDGVPGHLSQSRGLVFWLSQYHKVECEEREVALRLRPVARLLLPFVLDVEGVGHVLTELSYRRPAAPFFRPDLIISAGGNTSFLNVALARKWSVPNVFLGSKRKLSSKDFSAHLTLEPTGEPHNIVMDLVPAAIDPKELKAEGGRLRRRLRITGQQTVYAMVIGGDGSGFSYDVQDWRRLGGVMTSLAARDKCKWLITTSRRTGASAEKLLKESIPKHLVADSVWWAEEPEKLMGSYLGAADAVFVTADSMTMLGESIASQKPVIVLEPAAAEPPERYRNALRRFEAAGYCELYRLNSSQLPDIVENDNTGVAREKLLSEMEKLIPCLKRA